MTTPVFSLVSDIETGTSHTSIFSFTAPAGVDIVPGSWRTTMTANGRYIEAMTLVGKGGNAGIIQSVRALALAGTKARKFWEMPTEPTAIFLLAQADGEAYDRRAYVYNLEVVPVQRAVFSSVHLNRNVGWYDVTIERGAWLNDAETSLASPAAVTVPCTMIDLTSPVAETTLPAQIVETYIGTGTGRFDNVWVGLWPEWANSGFAPLWEAELGTAGGAYATLGTDAEASPLAGANNAYACNLTTTSRKLITITIDDVSADLTGWQGRYLVLARVRANAIIADQIGMTLYAGVGTMVDRPEVFRTYDTDFTIVELGEITIPVRPDDTYAYALELWGRTTGAGVDLIVDCLMLVPSYAMFAARNLGATGAYVTEGVVFDTPARRYNWRSYLENSTGQYALEFSSQGWNEFAPDDFRAVVVVDADIADTDIEFNISARTMFQAYGLQST